MRLRKIKNALDKLQANTKYFVSDPASCKGNWKSLFENEPFWVIDKCDSNGNLL